MNIFCVVKDCGANTFAMLDGGHGEPSQGMYLPTGWGAVVSTEPAFKNFDYAAVDFYCPQHNPGLKKTSVTVEEKDQSVVEPPESVTEPEDLIRASVRIAQGEKPGNVVDRIIAQLEETSVTLEIAAELGLYPTPQSAEVEEARERLVAFFVDVVSAAGMIIRDRSDVDFHTASIVNDPVNPDCGVRASGPEKLMDPGEPAPPLDGVDLFEHCHPTTIGPTTKATYRAEDSKHTHASPVGPISWELQTPNHTHEIDIVNDNRTGPPITQEVESTEKQLLQYDVYAAQAALDRAVKDLAKAREQDPEPVRATVKAEGIKEERGS